MKRLIKLTAKEIATQYAGKILICNPYLLAISVIDIKTEKRVEQFPGRVIGFISSYNGDMVVIQLIEHKREFTGIRKSFTLTYSGAELENNNIINSNYITLYPGEIINKEITMAKWAEALDVAHIFNLYETQKISVSKMGLAVAARLKGLQAFHDNDQELLDLIAEFSKFDDLSSIDDFNTALKLLYDWSDDGNKLWIISKRKDSDFVDDEDTMREYNASLPNVSSNDNKQTNTALAKVDAPIQLPPEVKVENTITCEPNYRGRTYPASRETSYMSEDDFNKKLGEVDVNPKSLPTALYSYMKSQDSTYQTWLIERFKKHNLHLKDASTTNGNN